MKPKNSSSFVQAQKTVEQLVPSTRRGERFTGLHRIQELLARIENPHLAIPCIHVGGTAGKGSTATLIAAMLQQAGYKTGLHVSPHLIDIRERMQINQTLMPEDRFVRYVNDLRPVIKTMANESKYGQPSYFEILLAIAFLYFRDEKVGVAVYEVGLGGMYDGTNVVHPLVSVLTNVGLDHTEILGDTVEKIASDKVGIFKKNTPVVTGVTQPSVIKIVTQKAKQTNSAVYRLGKDFFYKDNNDGTFDFRNDTTTLHNLTLNLIGEHQRKNASLAIQTALLARNQFTISDEAIRTALQKTSVIGRFERVGEKPITILDGAHNPDKIVALKETLIQQFPGKKITFVFAVKKDKDATEMLSLLAPIAKQFYFTRFEAITDFGKNMSKDFSKQTVAGVPCQWIPSAQNALESARSEATADDVICITGSLYLVGEIRQYLFP